mmetsp:Transcript_15871/g.34571  ORF Transcript_15871/g.34571 Transcript_15871/m.34571 type:complete len:236 (-) Transcript_15871:257-964(-)
MPQRDERRARRGFVRGEGAVEVHQRRRGRPAEVHRQRREQDRQRRRRFRGGRRRRGDARRVDQRKAARRARERARADVLLPASALVSEVRRAEGRAPQRLEQVRRHERGRDPREERRRGPVGSEELRGRERRLAEVDRSPDGERPPGGVDERATVPQCVRRRGGGGFLLLLLREGTALVPTRCAVVRISRVEVSAARFVVLPSVEPSRDRHGDDVGGEGGDVEGLEEGQGRRRGE